MMVALDVFWGVLAGEKGRRQPAVRGDVVSRIKVRRVILAA